MPRRKVEQVFEGEWTWHSRRDRMICCDCSLVHRVEFRIRKGKIELRMYRDNRSTAAFRRGNGIKLTTKKS